MRPHFYLLASDWKALSSYSYLKSHIYRSFVVIPRKRDKSCSSAFIVEFRLKDRSKLYLLIQLLHINMCYYWKKNDFNTYLLFNTLFSYLIKL